VINRYYKRSNAMAEQLAKPPFKDVKIALIYLDQQSRRLMTEIKEHKQRVDQLFQTPRNEIFIEQLKKIGLSVLSLKFQCERLESLCEQISQKLKLNQEQKAIMTGFEVVSESINTSLVFFKNNGYDLTSEKIQNDLRLRMQVKIEKQLGWEKK